MVASSLLYPEFLVSPELVTLVECLPAPLGAGILVVSSPAAGNVMGEYFYHPVWPVVSGKCNRSKQGGRAVTLLGRVRRVSLPVNSHV